MADDQSDSGLSRVLESHRDGFFQLTVGFFIVCLTSFELFLANCYFFLVSSGAGQLQSSDGAIPRLLGGHISAAWLNQQSPLWSALELLCVLILVVVAHASLLFASYRIASQNGTEFTASLYRAFAQKNQRLSIISSRSGQHARLEDLLSNHIPSLHRAREGWSRNVPRFAGALVAAIFVSLVIHPSLTLLIVVCFVLIQRAIAWFEGKVEREEPIWRERNIDATQKIEEQCMSGVLWASVHAQTAVDAAFSDNVRAWLSVNQHKDARYAYQKPIRWIVNALLLGVIGVSVSVQALRPNNPMPIADLITLAIAVAIALAASRGVMKEITRLRKARKSLFAIREFLALPEPDLDGKNLLRLDHLANVVTMQNVVLDDANGNRLIENIDLQMKVGELIAIVCTDKLQGSAIAELLLGFGKPAQGKLLFDNIDASKVSLETMQKHSTWIAPDGPLIAGTLEENLSPDGVVRLKADVLESLRAVNVYDTIQNLADGLSTLVSTNDDRLKPDDLFRIGIARSLLKKPTFVVAEEPSVKVSSSVEQETLQAMQKLANQGSLVVVMAHRLATLRSADKIIVVHDRRIFGVGTHAQLLEVNELYRHLNYIRFSPLRHITV